MLKWEPAFREIKIREFNPGTSNKKKIERKELLRQKIDSKIGKNLKKIQSRCKNRSLLIDVRFYLYYSDEQGRTKKDLDNLLKILLDVLSVNMINNKKNPKEGLGIVMDDSDIRKIICEKQIVNSTEKEGIDLQISIGH